MGQFEHLKNAKYSAPLNPHPVAFALAVSKL